MTDHVRKPGRPRVTEARSSVSTWIPVSQHERLIQMARQREVSVSALIKAFVTVGTQPKKST